MKLIALALECDNVSGRCSSGYGHFNSGLVLDDAPALTLGALPSLTKNVALAFAVSAGILYLCVHAWSYLCQLYDAALSLAGGALFDIGTSCAFADVAHACAFVLQGNRSSGVKFLEGDGEGAFGRLHFGELVALLFGLRVALGTVHHL
jgi:hypothetical protein